MRILQALSRLSFLFNFFRDDAAKLLARKPTPADSRLSRSKLTNDSKSNSARKWTDFTNYFFYDLGFHFFMQHVTRFILY